MGKRQSVVDVDRVDHSIEIMQSVLFALLAFAVLVQGAPRAEERIVGASPAPPPTIDGAPFPFMVSIAENGNHVCGGFIYNYKYVVTAASCVDGRTISLLTVVAGQYNLIEEEGTEQIIPVFKVTPFDNYVAANKTHDIALVELSSNLKLNITPPYYANLIEFNEVNTDAGFDPVGSTMGWGATVSGGGVSPRLRYSVTSMSEASSDCASYTADDFGIATMICATSTADPQISPCTFDEGSPLIQTYGAADTQKTIVVGVLSKRSPTCDGAVPSVFTRLSVYYAWLNRVAGAQIAAPPAPQKD